MISLPIEIFTSVLSFLPYTEVYRLRSVCKKWKCQCEYALYSHIGANKHCIKVNVFDSNQRQALKEINLVSHQYDACNQVIEFIPEDPNEVALIHRDREHANMSILFEAWSSREQRSQQMLAGRNLGPLDLALLAFHLDYNYFEARRYPIWRSDDDEEPLHYQGDRGIAMVYSNSLKGHSTCFCIQSLHVHLSWLIAGFFPDMVPRSIYEQRQSALADHLQAHGLTDFYPYSEHALKHILAENDNPISVQDFQKEEPSRLQLVERELDDLGIDPRNLWKYSYMKSVILIEELELRKDAVLIVQKSEEDWQGKKSDLLKKMNCVL